MNALKNLIKFLPPGGIEPALTTSERVAEMEKQVALFRREEQLEHELLIRHIRRSFGGLVKVVCRVFLVSEFQIFGRSREQRVCDARHVAMERAYERGGLSSSEIAAFFGVKNHATILHAVKAVAAKAHTDKVFKKRYNRVIALLKSSTENERTISDSNGGPSNIINV